MMDRPTGGYGSDPWSEVPADLEEMLRAELARKTSGAAAPRISSPAPAPVGEVSAEAPAAPKRGRPRKAAAETTSAAPVAEPTSPVEAEPAKAKRTTRTRTTKATAATSEATPADEVAKPARRPRATKAVEPAPEEPAAKPTRRRTTKAAAAEPAAE